jgi:hypothetical protein
MLQNLSSWHGNALISSNFLFFEYFYTHCAVRPAAAFASRAGAEAGQSQNWWEWGGGQHLATFLLS